MQMTVVDACHWHLISSIFDSAPPTAASESEGFAVAFSVKHLGPRREMASTRFFVYNKAL